MERKIGETIKFEGKTLRVEEIKDDSCKGCFFDSKYFCSMYVGRCNAGYRTDKKNIIFVEVKEQPQEQTEKPQKLNLCEILKDCPKGEMIWSPVFGDVWFYDI